MRRLKSIALKIVGQRMPSLTKRDELLAQNLRNELKENMRVVSDMSISDTWGKFCIELQHQVNSSDPREFLQWPVIRKSMFVSNPRYIRKELDFLKSRDDWKTRWRLGIRESPIGRPRPYPRYLRSSGNLIHHAYSLARFESFSGVKVRDLGLVYEFGGGYGSMARLVWQLGFQGHYVIHDLPPFSALQRFYLESIGWQEVEENRGERQWALVSTVEHARKVLKGEGARKPKLFIATWSLSESPVSLRKEILENISDFEYMLIAFQEKFECIDNKGYFQDWMKGVSGYDFCISEIEHLNGNWYLFARPCKEM